MEFLVLGEVEAHVDGTAVPGEGQNQQRALLSLLLIHAGEVLSSDRIIDALWGETPPKGMKGTLQRLVYDLRQSLEPRAHGRQSPSTVILTRGSAYILSLDGHTLDARIAEGARDEAVESLASRPEQALTCVARAMDLWRGRPYQSVADFDFAHAEIARLNDLKQSLLAIHGEALIALGREEEAIAAVRDALDDWALNEKLWGLLIQATYGARGPAAARAEFERAKEALDEVDARPSPELTSLLRNPPQAWRRPLPTAKHAFFGRKHEVESALHHLEGGGLATFTGIGGIGKTRIAVEVARRLAEKSGCDAVFCDLADVADADSVDSTVAEACGLRQKPGRPSERALIELLASEDVVMVLDNCEHVLSAARRLAERLLDGASNSRIIATSREPLGVASEHVTRVHPFDVRRLHSDSEDDGVAAVELLFDAAQRFGEKLEDRDRPVAARLCQLVGGYPLAIELAGQRLPVVGLTEMVDELSRSSVSPSNARSPTRLREAIAWSYDELDDESKKLFRSLGTTVGSIGRDVLLDGWATAFQMRADVVDEAIVRLDRLGLVEPRRSHRSTNRHAAGKSRYVVLEPIRQYAVALLDERKNLEGAFRGHADVYAKLAVALGRRMQVDPLTAGLVTSDRGNMTAAMQRAIDLGWPELAARIAGALDYYWVLVGKAREGLRWIERILEALGYDVLPTSGAWSESEVDHGMLVASLTRARGFLAGIDGDYPTATRWLRSAIEGFDQLSHRLESMRGGALDHELERLRTRAARGGAWGRFHLARSLTAKHFSQFGFSRASPGTALVLEADGLYRTAQEVFERESLEEDLAFLLPFAGWNAIQSGAEHPEDWFRQAIHEAESHNLWLPAAIAKANLAWFYLVDRPAPAAALTHLDESIDAFEHAGDLYSQQVGWTIKAIAAVQTNDGDLLRESVRRSLDLLVAQGSPEWDFITLGVATVALAPDNSSAAEAVCRWLSHGRPGWRDMLNATGVPSSALEFDCPDGSAPSLSSSELAQAVRDALGDAT